ncbi:hypothetical protein L1887_06466 [Cichorium endivia]|nr:hypothetical protein L1887_06466 [Cichorium endivia]
MASFKSSSSSVGRWTHEVFLSFRGEDTRNNFVDHLYAALDQRGIHAFKDDKALDKGKPISLELLKAIEESKFAVVVFSKNYADSSWCLDELVKIMECHQTGQMVLPVFYHVDPSDVRGQKREFHTAFQQQEDKFRREMHRVNMWRKALVAAAGLSGWHIKETGYVGESAIILEIVEKISADIRPCDMENNLIGIESRIDELYSLLGMEATGEEMGWHIVHESFPNSRLWRLQQIHDCVNGNKQNLKAIEAIMLMDNEYHVDDYDAKLGLSADVFDRMKKLRLLDIDGKFTSCQPTFLPDELRWLRWNEYPFLFLPLADKCKLVGLEMANGDIKHLWNARKILPNLKFIHLEHLYSLTSFPDVSGAPNIERLILANCWGLEEVHKSLGSHKRLVYLDMNGCTNLERLPSSLEMESLETLILSRCESLKRFPKVSPCMVKLSQIDLYSCSEIKELPSSIRYLCSLSFLNLAECSNLENIPNSICDLKVCKCAAVNHRLSIAIPGSKIPSWIKQEKGGCRIALKLPHKWHNKIMGFVVCGVFPRNIQSSYACPSITFRILSDGKVIPRSEINYMMDATETAKNGRYVWISYMPLGFFQQMYHDLQPEDWSLIKGNLDITVCLGNLTRSLRCGAHVIYKEDIKQIPYCISDYGNVVHVDEEDVGYDETISGNTYVYEEKFVEKSLMPLRSRTSTRRNTKHIYCYMANRCI